MNDDLDLFGEPIESGETTPQSVRPAAPVAEWQVDLIRKALDARGIAAAGDRQALVARLAGRSVASLRELTSEEALTVLNALGKDAPQQASRSLWDDREGATWIDRM